MKVLHLSTSDLESGAGRAAFRVHQGLQNTGIVSQMLVRAKDSSDPQVIAEKSIRTKLGPPLSGLPFQLTPTQSKSNFSLQWFPDNLTKNINRFEPNIINLHWICNGFLQVETLRKIQHPLVWTLHDMWPFTGGCHYSKDCDRYTDACGSCPQLTSNKQQDLSRWVWNRKHKAWNSLNLTIIGASHWIANCARSSSLFRELRVEVIPTGIDIEKYRPIPQSIARSLLQLPQDKKIVLFGAVTATDTRKGFHLLQPALQELTQSEWQDQLYLLTFGTSHQDLQASLGLQSSSLGKLSDDLSLAIAYSAADVFVAPSTQDNLPNTVMEALACGVPSVAFKIGGMPDMIDHCQNGYLAQPFEIEDLAQGIAWVIEEPERHQKLSYNARQKVEQEFTLQQEGSRYLKLYEEILSR